MEKQNRSFWQVHSGENQFQNHPVSGPKKALQSKLWNDDCVVVSTQMKSIIYFFL